jgi:hypothetical protein
MRNLTKNNEMIMGCIEIEITETLSKPVKSKSLSQKRNALPAHKTYDQAIFDCILYMFKEGVKLEDGTPYEEFIDIMVEGLIGEVCPPQFRKPIYNAITSEKMQERVVEILNKEKNQ